MTDRFTVLIATSTFPRTPDDPVSARFVHDLAQHLADHVRVVVLAPAVPGAPDRQRWDEVLVVRHRYFVPESLQLLTGGEGILATMRSSLLARAQLPLLLVSQLAAIPRVVRREEVDLVNSHWIVPQGFNVALWRRRLGIPHVVTAHAADVAYLQRAALGRRLARYVFDRTDGFLPVSTALASEVEELVGRPVEHRVVPMGVSGSLFRPATEAVELRVASGERVILFVGKLVPKKGVDVLLRALAKLREREVPVRVVLIGGGPLEKEIKAMARSLNVEGALDLLGWRRNDDLPSYYAAADVVCVPSIRDERGETEGMPVVVQEALAMGALLVASEISGIPDLVEDGEQGFLVPPGDSESLADTLEQALRLSDQRREVMAERARESALEHTWERVAERYVDTFMAARNQIESSGGASI